MLLDRINCKIEELKHQEHNNDYTKGSIQSLLVRKRVLLNYLKRFEDEQHN